MIHARPICFDCEEPIQSAVDAVFAPPYCDHPDCGSACFHGVCLMRWRERREAFFAQMEQAKRNFLRHLAGDCSCEGEA